MASTIAKLRSFHIGDMAVFDWASTAVMAIAIGTLINHKSIPAIAGIFILMVVAAIIVHYSLGIPTMLNVYLGLAKKEDVYAAREKSLKV